jgi:hypothetical protein
MKRIMAVTLALLFALPYMVSAQQASGKIKMVDRADQAFVLEDGTRLWIDEGRLADLTEGEKVEASFATKDGKRIVTDLERRTVADGAETTNFGSSTSPFSYNSIEADE